VVTCRCRPPLDRERFLAFAEELFDRLQAFHERNGCFLVEAPPGRARRQLLDEVTFGLLCLTPPSQPPRDGEGR
jgi:hypothetical protein